MRHLVYFHQRNVALVETLGTLVHKVLAGRQDHPQDTAGRHPYRRRILVAFVWILALIIQGLSLWLVAELIELAHGVIELYLELADLQLTLQSQYVAVTGP